MIRPRSVHSYRGRHLWKTTAVVWACVESVNWQGLRSHGCLLVEKGRCRPCIDWPQMVKVDISRGFSWNDLPKLTADRKQRKELVSLYSLMWKRIEGLRQHQSYFLPFSIPCIPFLAFSAPRLKSELVPIHSLRRWSSDKIHKYTTWTAKWNIQMYEEQNLVSHQ